MHTSAIEKKPTTAFADQKPGTSGLRKKVSSTNNSRSLFSLRRTTWRILSRVSSTRFLLKSTVEKCWLPLEMADITIKWLFRRSSTYQQPMG